METDCTVYEQWALLLGASLAITCSCLKNTTEQVNFIKEEEEEKEKKQSPILTWKQKNKNKKVKVRENSERQSWVCLQLAALECEHLEVSLWLTSEKLWMKSFLWPCYANVFMRTYIG